MSLEEQIPPAAEGQQQQTAAATATEDANDPNHEEAFNSRLRSQVEFYFSPQNLSRDGYLRNMLTASEYQPDIIMPTTLRPLQFMCPVGVITNFPKVRDIIIGARKSLLVSEEEPPAAILLVKALEGRSNVVTVSEDGNWIGPANQQLPPPAVNLMGGGAMGGQQFVVPMGSGGPHPYPQQGYAPNPMLQQGGPYGMNPMQGMMMVPPPPPPPVQQGEQGVVYQQQQQPGMPFTMGPSVGSDSPSSASVESMPFQQQQQAMNKLDASASSKVSVGTASVASLSSMPGPGAAPGQIMQAPPVPLMGQQGGAYPILQHGPSPPPFTMPNQNINMPPVAPYPMALPPMQQPLGPGMPLSPPGPGGQQPYPYYNPQQVMAHQVAYPPGNYMQQQQSMQQQGGPQQQPMQPAYMPHPQMMGYGGIPPPSPQHGYGPPSPYPYQGMQQYVDGYHGGGGGQGHYNHGYPPPRQQYNDQHRVGSPGFHGDNHHGQQHKKRMDKKKKKNNQHQHGGRDSYSSASPDNDNGQRMNNEYNNHSHHHDSQQDRSKSPPGASEHHRGGGAKVWKKRVVGEHSRQYHGSGDQQSSFGRRGNNNASPSFGSRYRNHHHSDRLSSGDTTPSTSSSRRQNNKGDDKKDIFSSSDFPGLGGGGGGVDKSDKSLQQIDKKPNSNLAGYASALLKKKDAPANSFGGWENANNDDNVALAAAAVTADNEVDSLTRQTEEMEREILSEFHDLSLIGNDDANANHRQQGSRQTVGTAPSYYTMDASLRSATQPTNKLPILPAGPFENDADYSSESPTKKTEPVIDVMNSQDFPPSNTTAAEVPSIPPKEVTQPPLVSNDDRPKSTGAWGAKKPLADVIKDLGGSSR
mmetsp:Transcript_19761/g.42910  ORF Transcript_19761/g.42910 Transcript_19761/m.42910 type:complete len:863 (-) Transcript_19761:387-2975(-)|eukprot:CAMPEP_0172302036 /NCGR_PEP_ID=MMETSP1058-20130122/3796_1 /TAXON_ID=83371 /ORGANISM="Detonula confervacea, Strain CCMP 353" /LENGTH=862 /DNA_ID=CAMNT_0013012365 /DNA_START=202 /DNA_END=2790 /DNA_ORIENTATION=+